MLQLFRRSRHVDSMRPVDAWIRSVLGLLFLLCISACASNSLRIEGASAVGKAANTFSSAATQSLEQARAGRMAANAAVVASDPSCEPLTRISIYVPEPGTLAENVPLCADGSSPLAGYRIEHLSLLPIEQEQIEPTLLLIGAIADYGAALTKIAERPKTDISAELAKIAAKADQAGSIANDLLGADLPSAAKLLATEQASRALSR